MFILKFLGCRILGTQLLPQKPNIPEVVLFGEFELAVYNPDGSYKLISVGLPTQKVWRITTYDASAAQR